MACPLAHAYSEANSAHHEAEKAHSEPNLPVILKGLDGSLYVRALSCLNADAEQLTRIFEFLVIFDCQ